MLVTQQSGHLQRKVTLEDCSQVNMYLQDRLLRHLRAADNYLCDSFTEPFYFTSTLYLHVCKLVDM